MSPPTVYLGPYVDWLFTAKESASRFPLEPYYGNDPFWLSLDGKLVAAWTGPELPPEIKVHGRRYRRLPFTPYQRPPVRALRALDRSRTYLLGVADLREIGARGIQAEVDWLARVYAPEIARLDGFMGRPGTLRWGLVAYESG